MKIMQAAILVLIGALGAMLYLKVKGSPEPQVPVAKASAQATPQAPAQTAPIALPVVEPVATEPARIERKHSVHQSSRISSASRKPEPIADTVKPVAASERTPAPEPIEPIAPPVQPAPQPVAESAPARVEPPAPPPPARVTVPAGTLLPVRLIEAVSSDRNHSGDTFTATLDEPLVVDGFVIAEKGARVEGRIIETQQAGRVKGLSSIGLELTRLNTADGQHVEISTASFTKTGPQSRGEDAAKIGGAAAIGAAIGAIAGGGKGAAIGAGVGGAAGTGGVMATRGKPAVLPSETKISFRLNNPVTITERPRRP
jgi:hypothetical protein